MVLSFLSNKWVCIFTLGYFFKAIVSITVNTKKTEQLNQVQKIFKEHSFI